MDELAAAELVPMFFSMGRVRPALLAFAEHAPEPLRLKALGKATGFFARHARHVLAHAQNQPRDPQLPWLLYAAVQSTRGGCRAANNAQQSQALQRLLQQRFAGSQWAKKAPYWFP